MTKDAVHYMVKQRLKKAGLDASLYSSHKLRHTAATLMLQNGVDVRTLQEVLGHENLNTTQIYTHVDNENLRSAAKANPLGRMKKKSIPFPLENRNRRPLSLRAASYFYSSPVLFHVPCPSSKSMGIIE